MKPKALFDELEKGLLQLFKAADLYNFHLIALARNEDPPGQLIKDIIATNTISTYSIFEGLYSKSEQEEFAKRGYLRAIGDQILLATYTALECYLIEKFNEYVEWKGKDKEERTIACARRMRRSLDDIRNGYSEILDIHLAHFELNESWMSPYPDFQPSTTWQRIREIENARHEVAHRGRADSCVVRFLSNAWEPFDFARRWVTAFDANFDSLIFHGTPTPMIKGYQKRVAQVRGDD
ncbi:MAG: hypothetical protein C4576_04920 [Desulfobacteraceae bacterium]|nr:MAG: hypothetical protein C4576_04920 [Desulfobacteraceae bacterium]